MGRAAAAPSTLAGAACETRDDGPGVIRQPHGQDRARPHPGARPAGVAPPGGRVAVAPASFSLGSNGRRRMFP